MNGTTPENNRRLFVSPSSSIAASSPVFKQPTIKRTKKRHHRQPSKTSRTRQKNYDKGNRRSAISSTWDFDKFIRSEFDTAEVANETGEVRWHRCPGSLADAILQLTEDASTSTLPNVFREHETELLDATSGSKYEVQRIYQMKQKLLSEILRKMYSRLRDCSLPDTLKPQDLDVESIVTKRAAIQQRYQEEASAAEQLAIELQKEQNRLEETRRVLKDLKGSVSRKRNDQLVTGEIHPALLPAIQNAYGVAGLSGATNTSSNTNVPTVTPWQRDVAEMNLVIPSSQHNPVAPEEEPENEVKLAMPGLAQYDVASRQLDEGLNRVLDASHLPDAAKFFDTFDKHQNPSSPA